MANDQHKLNLGKGVRFVKSQLRRLPQSDEVWEADFRPTTLDEKSVWQGLVVGTHGLQPAERLVEEQATVNDMADLLADAMRRPLDEDPRRPRTLRIRKRREWEELLPHLEELGIRVVSAPRLAKWDKAFDEVCRSILRSGSGTKRPAVEDLYPSIAQWVRGTGWIEIGDQEGFGFVARALDYGGLVFEDKTPRTLADALAALERALADDMEARR